MPKEFLGVSEFGVESAGFEISEVEQAIGRGNQENLARSQ